MIRFIIAAFVILIILIATLPVLGVLFVLRIFLRDRAERSAQSVISAVAGILLVISGAQVKVTGLENIPENEPVLFYSNHRSYFDIIAGYAVLRKRYSYVAKIELFRYPVFRRWMQLIASIFLDRKDPKSGVNMVIDAQKLLARGVSVYIFAEGTRAKKGPAEEMHFFHNGSFKPAQRSGCRAVPVLILGTREIFEDHLPCVRPGTVELRIGRPIDVASIPDEERKNIGDYMQRRLKELF